MQHDQSRTHSYGSNIVRVVFFAGLFLLSACASEGCEFDGFIEQPFPDAHYDKTIPNSGQIQLTQHGLEFLESQAENIVDNVLDEGLNFCVPKGSTNGVTYCVESTCADGFTEGCQIDLSLDETKLTPIPTQQFSVDITIGSIDELIKFDYATALGTVKCEIQLHKKDHAENIAAEIKGHLPISFVVDNNNPTRDLRIDVGELDFDLDDVAFPARGRSGVGSALACASAEVIVRNLFMDMIEAQLKNELNGAVQQGVREQLCRQCGEGMEACPTGSSCRAFDEVQVCTYQGTNDCVPRPLGIEGQLLLGQLIADYTQHAEAAIDLMVKGADHVLVETGVGLGIRAGFQATEHERCVPLKHNPRPSLDVISFSNTLRSEAHPTANKPYMLGVAFHKRSIQHMLWSVWASGALCIKVTSDTIAMLSTDALGTFLPSMQQLTTGNHAVILRLAPQTAPEVVLGTNKVRKEGNQYVVEDALIRLDWKDVDVHFYAYTQDRIARVFTLRVDMDLPLAIVPMEHGAIQFVLGDLNAAMQNVRLHGPSLLEESEQRVSELLPTLLGVVTPTLLEAIGDPIELPNVFGYRIALEQEDITSIDDANLLALFANLERVEEEEPPALVAAVQPMIVGTELDYQQRTPSGLVKPRVYIDVATFFGTHASDSSVVEYSYRLNNGFWSAYHTDKRLVIEDAALLLQGTHSVTVRSRVQNGTKWTYSLPQRTEIVVDYQAPHLEIERQGLVVKLEARDVVDTPEELQYRYRIVGGQSSAQWSEWSPSNRVTLDNTTLSETIRFDAEVRDRAGNVKSKSQTMRLPLKNDDWREPGDLPTASQGGCGCSTTNPLSSQSAGGFALLVFFVLGGVWLQRRRNAPSRMGLSLLVLLSSGVLFVSMVGCGSSTADDAECKGEECGGPAPCIGEGCAPVACESDAQCSKGCADGMYGVCGGDGQCQCRSYCEEGCSESQFCCYTSNSCQDFPDWCANQVCDPGFEPKISKYGDVDHDSCVATEGSCECVQMPPLPLGWHGAYGSIASNGSVTAASVYNRTYRDLMVATLDNNLEPTWYFVDGVPEDGDIGGWIEGPRDGIITRGSRVGTYTALDIDSRGTIHVLYQDQDNMALKYARGTLSGSDYRFETTTLDSSGETGYWNQIVIIDDIIHAVYTAFQEQITDQSWQSELRYISFDADKALESIAVTPEVLYTDRPARASCSIGCPGGGYVCFEDTASCMMPDATCSQECGANQACRQGECRPTYTQHRPRTFPKVASLFNQLTVGPQGDLIVVFYASAQDTISWIRKSSQQWSMAQFLGIKAGPYASGQLDQSGRLHLAYMDPDVPGLFYWHSDMATPEMIVDGLRDNQMGWHVAEIGENVRLRLLDGDKVRVTFQDSTAHVFYSASREGTFDWSLLRLGGHFTSYTGSHGFYGATSSGSTSNLGIEMVINTEGDSAEVYPRFIRIP